MQVVRTMIEHQNVCVVFVFACLRGCVFACVCVRLLARSLVRSFLWLCVYVFAVPFFGWLERETTRNTDKLSLRLIGPIGMVGISVGFGGLLARGSTNWNGAKRMRPIKIGETG